MNRYELKPITKQKSFYGKAVVEVDDDESEILYSYGTPIIKRTKTGKLIRLWNDYSNTTGKHIKAFCGLNKKEFIGLDMKH